VVSEQVWLPWMGWRRCNDKLQDQVESHFSVPMIFVALLILPLLAIKQFWQSALASNFTLRVVTDSGETIVWLAFTIEFIFMITIVHKKFGYCIRHWLDIFVICVPFLAFVRLARLGALFRLSQVSRLARAYRLRGLALRFYRGLLLLNIIERVLRLAPERRLKRLQDRLKEREAEVADLKIQIAELEEEIEVRAKKKAARQEAQKAVQKEAAKQEAGTSKSTDAPTDDAPTDDASARTGDSAGATTDAEPQPDGIAH